MAWWADRLGRHHVPLRDEVDDINELLSPDAVHHELIQEIVRKVYCLNQCGHLDAEISLENTPHPDLTIDGIRIETYFSPDDATAARIMQLILDAEESIDFLYYSFTSDGIADALLFQDTQGVQIRGVLDAYQERAGLGGEYQRLNDFGLDVFLDVHPEKLHHKVIIIDNKIVITGSYNMTRSAEVRNDENTLIIHNETLAGIYLGEFDWIYGEASQAQ